MAAGRARAEPRTGARQARQACAFWRRGTVTQDASGSTDEPEVTGRMVEVRTGRGSAGLVRGEDERCWADEISRKGKGKGNGGKGEHEGKGGGVGRKGTQQVENLVMDEVQDTHREDVRKLIEMMQKEEEEEREQEEERRAQEAREEERRAQEAPEEQEKVQKVREEARAREEELRPRKGTEKKRR